MLTLVEPSAKYVELFYLFKSKKYLISQIEMLSMYNNFK